MSTKQEAARGHYRTVQTDWNRLPPYIRLRYERARELLPKGGTVYELGCGIGVGLAHLARSRPDLKFIGTDISEDAIVYGQDHFSSISNLRLLTAQSLEKVKELIPEHCFLVAFEVLEHLNDEELNYFKVEVMKQIDEAVFSFPYNEQNIEGTEHLQSFDLYDIFEIFPGFTTLFLRRYSGKFIGRWTRIARPYLAEKLNVAREAEAIQNIANRDGTHIFPETKTPEPLSARARKIRKLRNNPRAFFEDSRLTPIRYLKKLFRE